MASILALILGSIPVVYVFLFALLRFSHDSREPPLIETSVPFIGPLFGLILGMQKYFVELR
jgi:hypothetical protein